MKHHILGPSSLPRTLNCIASLYGNQERGESSAAAREGTTCHALLEFCLTFGENPRNLLGSTDFSDEFPISIEMVEGVELFLDTVSSVCAEFDIPRENVRSEQKLVHPSVSNDMFGGTSDCIIVGDKTLVTIDLKFGRRQVYANSPQLSAYSILSLAHYGHPDLAKVVQIVVQPRGNPSVDRFEPGQDELGEVWTKIKEAEIFLLENPDLTVPKPEVAKAGEWCKYCKQAEGCPARLRMVGEFSELAVMPVPDAESGHLKLMTGPTSGLSTEQLVDWMAKFNVISDFMKDVKKDLVKRAIRGEIIPGHKLMVNYGNREWVEDEEKIRKKIPRMNLGLAAKDITVQKMLSVPQIEKLLKEKENWKEIKDRFSTLYTSKPTGVKLANAKAKGVDVQPEALEELLLTMKDESDE